MAWYPADIFTDRKYLLLSRPAKLAYRELLDHCWLGGATLPDNPAHLAALLGCGAEEFAALWAELQNPVDPCFQTHPVTPGFLTNRRVWREWQRAEEQAARARTNGQKGGRPASAPAEQKTQAVAAGLILANPGQSSSQSPPQAQGNTSPPPGEGGRVPHREIIALYHQLLPELPRVTTWPAHRQEALRARCREDPARLDVAWWERFFRQLVRGSPLLMGQRGAWRADLEWLIKARNFAKVLDGAYVERASEEGGHGRFAEFG